MTEAWMGRTRMNRRTLLRSAGAAALLSPFYQLLEGAPANAQMGPAKFLLVFHTPGTDVDAWSPTGSSDNEIVFSEMTAPLMPIRDQLILLEGFDSLGTAGQHGAVGGLTGSSDWNSLYSLDQFVADQLVASGVSTSIPSLLLGSVPGEDQRSFWRPGGQSLAPITSPLSAYEAVFTGAAPSMPGMPGDDGAALLARRRSSLDLLKDEFQALSNRLGAEERAKLELHAESLRNVEQRLEGQLNGGSTDCTAPTAPVDSSQDRVNSRLNLVLAIAAFSCDVTRVAAVQFGHHQNTQVAIPGIGTPGNWHNDFMHSDPAPRSRLVAVERWLCEQLVAAADQLKATPSPTGGGSLWDETLIIWTRDMGDGISHAGDDMKFVLTGGAGGYLRTSPNGRYINGGGSPHLQVLLSAAEGMGVTDFQGFGDMSLGGDRQAVAGARS
ncbi:MAG: DUF1552 domain-containing protein [Myxococcota bacterium]